MGVTTSRGAPPPNVTLDHQHTASGDGGSTIFPGRVTVTGVNQLELGVALTQSGFARFRDINTSFFNTLGIPAAGFTANRNTTLPDIDGDLLMVGNSTSPAPAGKIAKVNLTGQAANIASTILTNATPAGFYMLNVNMVCTTAAASGTLAFNASYTDESGAQTKTLAQLVLTAAKNTAQNTFPIFITSGNITWTTTGYVASAVYAIHIRCSYLGS